MKKEDTGKMGVYLNGKNAYGLFQEAVSLTYFVDKTDILNELAPILELKKGAAGNVPEAAETFQGGSPKYLYHQTAPIWKDNGGEYDRVFFRKGSRQQSGVRQSPGIRVSVV